MFLLGFSEYSLSCKERLINFVDHNTLEDGRPYNSVEAGKFSHCLPERISEKQTVYY